MVPAKTSLEDILALKPDGVFLSNGPGDPAATGEYAVPVIKALLEQDMPIFGICLGHQMLGAGGGRARPPRCSRATAAPTTRSSALGDGTDQAGRDHQHEPRLRGRQRDAARRRRGNPRHRCSTAPTAALRSRARRRSACSTTPRRARGRRTASTCSRSSWGCWGDDSQLRSSGRLRFALRLDSRWIISPDGSESVGAQLHRQHEVTAFRSIDCSEFLGDRTSPVR